MNDATDHPDVIVFPPILLVATIALGVALQWLWPLRALAALGQPWRIAIGATVVLAGLFPLISGRRTMVRHGTNVNPTLPSTAVVTDGVFRWTRNPLYVGGFLAMIGIALIFALDWLLPLLVPSALILHFGIVRREEDYLERKFGDEYRRYRNRVRRYLSIMPSGS